ncbi:MAG: nucleotidyl transferase AbiEii/AbiGii toxin family protein [Acidobacteriaceae bacterium]
MPESFFHLSDSEQEEALQAAASASGRPPHLLEKDIWVVWALSALFESPIGPHLVFKGGTALSKAYRIIRRFSEDVDLTYDIRALAPQLVENSPAGLDVIPPSRSQQKKWSDTIRTELLPAWIRDQAHPIIQKALENVEIANSRFTNECIFIDYKPVASTSSYVLPRVMLEFGARSTGEPANTHKIHCDMEEYIPDVSFPLASPRVMELPRIFWEKATAIHVYCAQGAAGLHDRFSRHLHDLMRIEETGHVDQAIQAQEIAEAVALHKGAFFIEKDSAGNRIDYTAAVRGALCLAPEREAEAALRADYQRMVDDGLLMDEAAPFDRLIDACKTIQEKANGPHRAESSESQAQ